jgi:hypothetical protein
MAVLGHDAALAQEKTSQHRLFAVHKLAFDKRIEVFYRNRRKTFVFPSCLCQSGLPDLYW